MKSDSIVRIAIPPIILGLLLSIIYLLPLDVNLLPSAISPELPYGAELDGWYGEKTQESERERSILAADTVFSKAIYRQCRPSTPADYTFLSGADRDSGLIKFGPEISVSIVYSGSDMNNSIHRPERCLPAQGHQDLRSSTQEFELKNGRRISFTRISSFTLPEKKTDPPLQHIHYYVFVGSNRVCHSHLSRVLYDIWDRVAVGQPQRWAYLQIGSYWGGNSNITEEESDAALQRLITELADRQIDWSVID